METLGMRVLNFKSCLEVVEKNHGNLEEGLQKLKDDEKLDKNTIKTEDLIEIPPPDEEKKDKKLGKNGQLLSQSLEELEKRLTALHARQKEIESRLHNESTQDDKEEVLENEKKPEENL